VGQGVPVIAHSSINIPVDHLIMLMPCAGLGLHVISDVLKAGEEFRTHSSTVK